MVTYIAHHGCDTAGVPYDGDGPIAYYGPSLADALRAAEERATLGQRGYVCRDYDGAVLAANGTWIPRRTFREVLLQRRPEPEPASSFFPTRHSASK